MRKKSFAKKSPRTSSSSLYLVKGNSSVNEERFEYLEEIRGRDGDPGGEDIGGFYKDKKTNIVLFAKRAFYEEQDLVNGKIVGKKVIVVHGIYLLTGKPKMNAGGTVSNRNFEKLFREPETKQEIEAAEALYDNFKTRYAESAGRIFLDRTRRAVSQQSGTEQTFTQKLALN